MVTATPWLLYGWPTEGDVLLLAFHYAGTGAASTYRDWPRRIGRGVLCPLQPPGRETRSGEPPFASIATFAADLAESVGPLLDRPYAMVGHCGATPYMVESALALVASGYPPPARIFASAWGPPQNGPYGEINTRPRNELDVEAEIDVITRARFGVELPSELKELVAEVLLHDLTVLRAHHYDGRPAIPAPVEVISWSDDEIVPPGIAWADGWRECADARHRTLAGNHWEFLRAPAGLTEFIGDELARLT